MNKLLLALLVFCLGGTQAAVGDTIFVGDTDKLAVNSISQPHQDNEYNVNWLVDFHDVVIDAVSDLPYPLTLLGKWEVDDNSPDDGHWDAGVDPGFTGDFWGDSGTWAAPSGFAEILYYSIKTGSSTNDGGFELYHVEEGGLSGTWNTDGLENRNLSHISFWSAGSTPVPEPATLLLFGTGLLGMAGFARKRVSAKK